MTDRTLSEVGDGIWAWIQGDGSWGWSNSGLVAGEGGRSLLVDTLFTEGLTADMLAAYRRATPAADEIDVLVNTHSNGDHTFGNRLAGGARIVGSAACAAEMEERPAAFFRAIYDDPGAFGAVGAFFAETMFPHFDLADIHHVPPNDTFTGTRTVEVGGRRVELTELGPAHTRGDVIAHVPDARVVFTGDILFSGGHPIVWAGPVSNWIAACDHILGLDVETVVPGHGPVGGKGAVRDLRAYLTHVETQARAAYEAGLPWDEAAWEVGYEAFDSWLDRERVVANVAAVYRELSGGAVDPSLEEVMHQMLRYRRGAGCPHDGPCGCGGGAP